LEYPVAGDRPHAEQLSAHDCEHFYHSIFLKRSIDILVSGEAEFNELKKLVIAILGENPRISSAMTEGTPKALSYENGHILLSALGHLHPDYDYSSLWQNILLAKFVGCLDEEGTSLGTFVPAFLDLDVSGVCLWKAHSPDADDTKIISLL